MTFVDIGSLQRPAWSRSLGQDFFDFLIPNFLFPGVSVG